jgi:hypothetical protein
MLELGLNECDMPELGLNECGMLELGLNERGELELGLNELGLGLTARGKLRDALKVLAGLGLAERGTLRDALKVLAGLGAGLGLREPVGGVKPCAAPVAGGVRKRDGASPCDAGAGARKRAACADVGTLALAGRSPAEVKRPREANDAVRRPAPEAGGIDDTRWLGTALVGTRASARDGPFRSTDGCEPTPDAGV